MFATIPNRRSTIERLSAFSRKTSFLGQKKVILLLLYKVKNLPCRTWCTFLKSKDSWLLKKKKKKTWDFWLKILFAEFQTKTISRERNSINLYVYIVVTLSASFELFSSLWQLHSPCVLLITLFCWCLCNWLGKMSY